MRKRKSLQDVHSPDLHPGGDKPPPPPPPPPCFSHFFSSFLCFSFSSQFRKNKTNLLSPSHSPFLCSPLPHPLPHSPFLLFFLLFFSSLNFVAVNKFISSSPSCLLSLFSVSGNRHLSPLLLSSPQCKLIFSPSPPLFSLFIPHLSGPDSVHPSEPPRPSPPEDRSAVTLKILSHFLSVSQRISVSLFAA